MSEQNIKDLLVELQQELENAKTVDSETMDLVRELDDDIHRLVDPDSDLNDWDSVIDRANVIQTRFAIEHPRAERFLREIVNALSRVGI